MTKRTIIHQPGDKLFKQAMSYPAVARQFLEVHLPKELLTLLVLDTLEIHKNSFIDANYYAGEADVLYSARLLDNTWAYFYTLVENQALNHAWMPFRLSDYQIQGSKDHLKQHPNTTQLPIFYPFVIYTGEAAWQSPRVLAELYAPYEKWANLFSKPYHLLELNRLHEDELKNQGVIGLIEYALQCQRYRKDLKRFCNTFLFWLNELRGQLEPSFRKMMIRYILGGIPGLGKQQANVFLENTLRQLPSEFRGEVMTIADYLDQQGFKRGILQGMKQGKLEGMQEGMQKGMLQKELEIAQQMLHKGLDRTLIQEFTHLSDEELEKLIEEN
jgi:recombination-promoting nuclease RpnB